LELEKLILNNIKIHREMKNISQDSVAMELNILQSGYAKLENNQNKITLNKVIKISEIIDVDFIQLLFKSGSLPTNLKVDNICDFIENLQNEITRYRNENAEIKSKYIELLEKVNKKWGGVNRCKRLCDDFSDSVLLNFICFHSIFYSIYLEFLVFLFLHYIQK
jgi:transcriptional regulator with XRE-family HTH domain